MKHPWSFLSLALVLLCVPSEVRARNVFVFPSSGTGPVVVYDTNLGAPATITAPSGAFQAFSDPVGNNYMVVSNSSAQAVTFFPKPLGSSTSTTVSLTQAPVAAAMLPDGTKLVVLGSNNLYFIDTVSQAVTNTVQVGAGPHSMAVSNDSKSIYVLSIGSDTMFAIDATTAQKSSQVTISGGSAVSVSPTGLIYVSTATQILEYDPVTFVFRGAFNTQFKGGKIAFTSDGKQAIMPNLSSVGQSSGSSLAILDLNNRTVTASITIGSATAPIVPEQMFMMSPARAIGYSSRSQRLYDINLSNLSAVEASYQPTGAILSMTISDEIPTRFYYFTTAGAVHRADAVAGSLLVSTNTTGGPVSYAGPASSSVTGGSPVSSIPINDGQSISGSATFLPLAVRVLDAENRPVYFVNVKWASLTPNATVTVRNENTGTNGMSVATVTAPANTGAITITANVGNVFTRTFTLTAGSGGGGGGGGGGTTAAFSKVKGDGQIYMVGLSGNSAPLVVKLLDANGSPVASSTITWTVTGDGFASPNSTTTDADGLSQVFYFTGAATIPFGSSYTTSKVMATSPGGQTVNFTMVLLPGGAYAPTITVLPEAGNRNITAKAGSTTSKAIRYTVITGGSSNGSSQPGVALPTVGLDVATLFTPDKGPAASCQGGTVLTDNTGQGACDLVAGGKVGVTTMTATVGGQFPVDFTLTVTPGDPASPVIVQGNNQTVNAGQTTPAAMVVQIADAFGNPVAGAPVTWESLNTSALTIVNSFPAADSNGRASAQAKAGNVPGTFQVRVTSGAGSALFNVTVNASLGGLLRVSGQDNPAVLVGTAFPQPLVVQVNDTQGRPVQGVPVAWAATNGTVSGATSTTNANGQASVNATAGNTAGAVNVTASVAGLPSVTFNLTARLPGPVLTQGAFTNFATGEPGVVKGGLVLIKAQGVAPVTGVVNASLLGGRLPQSLGDVTVQFDNIYAPIYQVANVNGAESILVQAPFELAGSTTSVTITAKGAPATINNIPVSTYGPGILEEADSAGRRSAIAIRSDGYRVSPITPARRGERIRVYVIGLGQTNPTASSNTVGGPNQNVIVPVVVGLNNAGVPLMSAKMADNLVGVYEVIFQVPNDMATGDAIPLGLFIEATPGVPTFANGSAMAIAAQ